jgi:hypothetical protein
MARGVSLGELIRDVKLEAGMSGEPAFGVNVRDTIVRKLRSVQQELYDEFDWPFMRGDFDKDMAAGQRYYDLPTGLVLESVDCVQVRWDAQWFPVKRGISESDYNAYDSELDVRNDPVLKWDVYGTAQFEVWPVPASSTTKIRFTGRRALRPLLADADTCDLDSDMLILAVAAEIAPKEKKRELAGRAFKRKAIMTGRVSPTKFNLNGKPIEPERERRPLVAYVNRNDP